MTAPSGDDSATDTGPEGDGAVASVWRASEDEIVECARSIYGGRRSTAGNEERRAYEVCTVAFVLVNEIRRDTSAAAHLAADESYAGATDSLAPSMVTLRSALGLDGIAAEAGTDDRIRAQSTAVLSALRRVLEAARSAASELGDTPSGQHVLDVVSDAEKSLARLDARGGRHSRDADDTGPTVNEQVRTDAEAEAGRAVGLRWAAVAVLLVIIVIAAWQLWVVPLDADLAGLELVRLSVAIPLAVLAGYLARESAKHRAAAQRLTGLRLQMEVLDQIADALATEDGSRYRYEVGTRIYTSYAPAEPEAADEPGIGRELVASLEKLVDAVRGARE